MPKKDEDELFRSWSRSHNTKMDPEVLRLEDEAHKTRMKIHEIREKGQKLRLHRLQALDALEMRRVTLAEILKRMDKELKDKDVYGYGQVMAEAFGERKINNHRAMGLEALLCQLMHQMLAKQHQLKILKKSAKRIEQLHKQHKIRNKDEFHSYGALAVQLEVARLSLEAMYDDIFAHQHRILAKVKNLNSEGNTTNYNIPTSTNRNTKPTLTVSTKHQVSPEDFASPDSVSDIDQDDFETAVNLLYQSDDDSINSGKLPKLKRPPSKIFLKNENRLENNNAPTTAAGKSARERRREIEHLRQSRVLGGASKRTSSSSTMEEEPDGKSHRQRMRELEAVRQKLSARSLLFDTTENTIDQKDSLEGGDLKPRGLNSQRKINPAKGDENLREITLSESVEEIRLTELTIEN